MNDSETQVAAKGSIVPIPPHTFAQAMKTHWEESLGNTASKPLVKQWETMGKTFNLAAAQGFNPKPSAKWHVLQPPTGTGKTQGAIVYSSLVAKQNGELSGSTVPTGVLIVTPFISAATDIADRINELVGRSVAIAKYTGSGVTADEMGNSDILVVTHRRYFNAIEDEMLELGQVGLKQLIHWRHGIRNLTIIDESPSDLVRSYDASVSDFKFLDACLLPKIRRDHPTASDVISDTISTVRKIEEVFGSGEKEEPKKNRELWHGQSDVFEWTILRPLYRNCHNAIINQPHDKLLFRTNNSALRQSVRVRLNETLKMVEMMRLGGGYRSFSNEQLTLHTARLMVPQELSAPVILDATANLEPIWGILNLSVNLVPKTPKVRDYRKVRLFVCRAKAVGKGKMIKQAEERLETLFSNLGEQLANKSTFLCVHKNLETTAIKFAKKYDNWLVDHWGNLNGRNEWKECEAAILVGLPFLPNEWAKNTIIAARREIATHNWPRYLTSSDNTKLRQNILLRKLSATIVQAINRVRCRRVIDDKGSCLPTDVFLTLEHGDDGEEILKHIKSEMPGIQIKRWNLKFNDERIPTRRAHYYEKIIQYVERHQDENEIDIKEACTDLGISESSKKDMQKDLRDADHPLTKDIEALGYKYDATRAGAASRSFLYKISE